MAYYRAGGAVGAALPDLERQWLLIQLGLPYSARSTNDLWMQYLAAYPGSLNDKLSTFWGSGGAVAAPLTVIEVAAGYLYARFPWDATYDCVQCYKVTADTPSMELTGVVQPWGIRKIPIATARANIASAFNASVLTIASQGDDPPPIKFNNTFVGGNHGHAIGVKVTGSTTGTDTAPHGKTFADIGSEWTDSSGNHCWIIEIINANELTFIRNNVGSNNNRWFYFSSLDAGTMTHVAGATNTASFIAKNFPTLRELKGLLRDMSRVIKLDGVTTVSVDGVYDCEFVTIEESYGIANPKSMQDYFIAGRPWATTPSMTHASVSTQVLVSHKHRIHCNGSIETEGRVEFLQEVSMFDGTGYVNFGQAQPIAWGGGTLSVYIARLNGVVGGIKTWLFANVETVSGSFEALDFLKASWASATNAPNRITQIVKGADTLKQFGFTLGYFRRPGTGAGTALHTYDGISSSWCSAARKFYIRCLTRGASALGLGLYDPIPAATVITATSARVPFNLASIQSATEAAVALFDGGAEVFVAFHEVVSDYSLPVPVHLNGKTVSIIDGSGITLNTTTVSGGAIRVTGGIGSEAQLLIS